MTDLLTTPICDGADTVVSICKEHGIDLRGDDGQPYCCGQRMTTKSGLFGTDWARCEKCKLRVFNLASPHINGGYVFDLPGDAYFHELKTWVARRGEDD